MTLDPKLVALLLTGLILAAVGVLYRRLRAQREPDVSDALFLERFHREHGGQADRVLAERKRVASVLGIPTRKVSPEQRLDQVRRRFAYLADFAVGANDLCEEAAEMRRLAGLPARRSRPETIGELLEDLVKGREAAGGSGA